MKHGAIIFLALMVCCAAARGQTYSNDAEAAAIRKKIETMRLERDRAKKNRAEVYLPWERSDAPAPARGLDEIGLVRIANKMERLRGALIFEPADARQTSATLRVLLLPNAEEWLTLAPGEWTVSLVAGEPGRGIARLLDERVVKIAARERREIPLNASIEDKWIARARAMAAQREKNADPAPGAGSTPTGSVTTIIQSSDN